MITTRVLYISDSIGLGHAARDLAIARELRALNTGIEIMWLAGDPARRLIAEAGEALLPETEAFAHETGVAEDASKGFSLNVLSYALRAQSAWNIFELEDAYSSAGRDHACRAEEHIEAAHARWASWPS